MKLSVIIPVYNEKDTINPCLNKVQQVCIDKEIIIVDDCSTDGTREILKSLQSSYPDIKVLFHEKNSGKGGAIRTAVSYVSGDYVMIQDADLEYNPNDYHKLIEAVKNNEAEVVYGSRFKDKNIRMSSIYFLANRFLTFLTNVLYKTKLTDMETCYKLVKRELISNLNINAQRFDFEPEITAKILRLGYSIYEVPIQYQGRKISEGKKITWRDGIQAIFCLVKYKFFN